MGFKLSVQGLQQGAIHSDRLRRGIVIGDDVLNVIQRRAETDLLACCAVRADQAVGVAGPEP